MNKLSILFALTLLVGMVFAANTGVNVTVGNADPVIVTVDAKGAEDPTLCTTTGIGAATFNVTDANGALDLNVSGMYINYTNGSVTHTADTCVNSSSGSDWMVVSCTGASFDYYDAANPYTMTVFAIDNTGGNTTDTSQSMTYNEGVLMQLNNGPITFGVVSAGSVNNTNTNAPAFNSENCGNVILNESVTGSDITDGGSNTLAIGQFRISDSGTPGAGTELVLTTGPQDYSKAGGQAISTGTPATWSLYSILNVPAIQAAATYDSGSWDFTPSKA